MVTGQFGSDYILVSDLQDLTWPSWQFEFPGKISEVSLKQSKSELCSNNLSFGDLAFCPQKSVCMLDKGNITH